MTGKNEVIAAARTKICGTFVAVGVFGAEFSERIVREAAPDHFYCVDPYTQYPEFEDSLNDRAVLARARKAAHDRMTPFRDRVSFIADFSVNAAKQFTDNSLDFIYVDGNHAYKFVTQDLEAWYPKLRRGGIMAGDDAHDVDGLAPRDANGDCKFVWTPTSKGLYGVRKAVQDFCRVRSIPVAWPGYQFIFQKPE